MCGEGFAAGGARQPLFFRGDFQKVHERRNGIGESVRCGGLLELQGCGSRRAFLLRMRENSADGCGG